MSRAKGAARHLIARYPRASLAVASVTSPLFSGPTRAELARVLPGIDRRRLDPMVRGCRRTAARNRVIDIATEQPDARWPFPQLDAPVAELPSRAVLAAFHVGALSALGAVLEALPGEVVALHGAGQQRRNLTNVVVGRHGRSRAFRQAIAAVERGESVFLTVDPREGHATIPVRILNRDACFARGAFALARITSAPLVPLAGEWKGTRLRVHVGAAIRGDDELAMGAQAAAWLDELVRRHPDLITRRFIAVYGGGSPPPAAPISVPA
jgi:hypothetical protein